MTHFDVFNGDADGLCALQQLRLAAPKDAMLVSGVKRDVALLQRVRRAQPGDSVTVLDLSLAVNRRRSFRCSSAACASSISIITSPATFPFIPT